MMLCFHSTFCSLPCFLYAEMHKIKFIWRPFDGRAFAPFCEWMSVRALVQHQRSVWLGAICELYPLKLFVVFVRYNLSHWFLVFPPRRKCTVRTRCLCVPCIQFHYVYLVLHPAASCYFCCWRWCSLALTLNVTEWVVVFPPLLVLFSIHAESFCRCCLFYRLRSFDFNSPPSPSELLSTVWLQ